MKYQNRLNEFVELCLSNLLLEAEGQTMNMTTGDVVPATTKTDYSAPTDLYPTQKQQPPKEKTEPFSLKKLASLDSVELMVAYASNTLKRIGMGSSRMVFELEGDPDWVLKIAMNDAGIAQNKAEATVCSADPRLEYFTKIDFSRSDKSGRFLISEYAEPMDESKWQSLTGISWDDYVYAMDGLFNKNPFPKEAKYADNLLKTNSWFAKLINIIKSCQYQPGDLQKMDSWGIGKKTNKLVIVDSGFTKAVYQAHYNPANKKFIDLSTDKKTKK